MTPPQPHLRTAARGLAIRYELARRAISERVFTYATRADDRGEGPVSTAIMVALIAAVAVGVGGVILLVANGWTAKIPKATP